MSADYFSENEAFTNYPLPSPVGTPYQSLSRRTSRYGSDAPSSPAPFPPDPHTGSGDTANNENISILDPRRFTPTLHANLVSEILNLRRELDSKHKFIEDLETNLHAARDDNDSLAQQLSTAAKESRNAKRQLQHFENETLAAIEEIAGERDKTREANADLKAKLEAAQKKSRTQEDDSNRVHDMWAREKEAWTGEKLALERRVHTSDTRLKILLDEIALQEAARDEAAMESEGEDAVRDFGLGPESDTASIRSSPQRRPSTRFGGRHSRNRSNGSYRSIGRGYRMSLMSTEGYGRGNGMSLADELVFDEEDEDFDDLELDSDDFPENEMRARRAHESRQSMYPDEKAKRILGLSNDNQPLNRDDPYSVEDSEAPKRSHETAQSSTTLTPRDITLVFPPTKPIYVDSGVQPSPPPSPKRIVMAEASSQTFDAPPPNKASETSSTSAEVEANQRRKRVSAARESHHPPLSVNLVPSPMISSSVQTMDHPLSPPATPKIVNPIVEPPSPVYETHFVSISTQTESMEEPKETPKENKRASPPASIAIPSIAIHAPSSAPSSPKEPILPPGTKTVSTQTTGDLFAPMSSTSMQTEPIRIDQRPVKLPAHLLPSAVTSKPGTPEHNQESRTADTINKDSHYPSSSDTEQSKARIAARQDLTTLLEKAANKKVENRYPGNNDNGPLSNYHHADILSRPFRTSSLFAGFDGPSSDEDDDDDVEISHEELKQPQFSTPMLSSRNSKNARPFKPPTPVPEDKEAVPSSRMSEDSTKSQFAATRSSFEKPAKVGKSARNTLGRQSSIRRSAMIQSGTAAHVRSRSPSIGSLGSSNYAPKPPFPVPTRSSSRNVPFSKSEGSQSPTPRYSGSIAGRRPYGVKHQRKDSLRKIRSAAPVARHSRSRSRSPTLPATPSMADTMSIPPLPSDVVSASGLGHRYQHSNATAYTANGSVNTSASQSSVVDAIAASMIGEFMWKYVRKRKTFGGPDVPADVSRAAEEASLASHGVRHKRWVWISPYERAILWSSKQPTSGAALMGKSGRKRKCHISTLVQFTDRYLVIIQSVLDVADNCPAPKNETLFNRSILILTPARALKFTTTSRERHYLWLTALSFLAHSNAAIPDLASMPPVPPPVIEAPSEPAQGAILRRSRVQDSVRLAKGKANPVMQRYASQNDMHTALPSLVGFDRPVPESASPPTVPRGPAHGRKRSSTGPGAPPPSIPFRSFSHQQVPSVYSNGSSDMYSAAAPPSVPSSVYNPNSGVVSSRTSEASTSTRRHFFDTMGTVRMEAFIDNALGDPKHAGNNAARTRTHRRQNASQWSASTRDPNNRAGGVFDDLEVNNDLFQGF
jgi:hypothetical protein